MRPIETDPVTVITMERAIEQCSEVFGETLAIALRNIGTEPLHLRRIAEALQAKANQTADADVQIRDICRTAVMTGFLKPFQH